MIGGYTEGGFGVSRLLIGLREEEGLRYVGEVEFGFSPVTRVDGGIPAAPVLQGAPIGLGPEKLSVLRA